MIKHPKADGIYIPETLREWLLLYTTSNHKPNYSYVEVNALKFVLTGAIDDAGVDAIIFNNGGNTVFDVWYGDSVSKFVDHLHKEGDKWSIYAYRVSGETTIYQYPLISTIDNHVYLVRLEDMGLVDVKQNLT